jgi:hypothetical protein
MLDSAFSSSPSTLDGFANVGHQSLAFLKKCVLLGHQIVEAFKFSIQRAL